MPIVYQQSNYAPQIEKDQKSIKPRQRSGSLNRLPLRPRQLNVEGRQSEEGAQTLSSVKPSHIEKRTLINVETIKDNLNQSSNYSSCRGKIINCHEKKAPKIDNQSLFFY
jgi:hypothetical protein